MKVPFSGGCACGSIRYACSSEPLAMLNCHCRDCQQSSGAPFASGVVVPRTGISLQNRGYGFTLEPGHPNQVAGGKRPFHTIIPAFVTQGNAPLMSFGVMGGEMQAQGHAQFLINHLVFGMDIQAAMDVPRFRHENGLRVIVESAMSDETIAGLRALGHEVSIARPTSFGGSQAIIKLAHGYVAGSDPRKDGHAAGY